MTVVKIRDYTSIENWVLENPKLSFAAKGIWAYLRTLPFDSKLNMEDLAKIDGEESIKSALYELESEGLIDIREVSPKKEGGIQ